MRHMNENNLRIYSNLILSFINNKKTNNLHLQEKQKSQSCQIKRIEI